MISKKQEASINCDFISDLMLGASSAEEVRDPRIMEAARSSVFHAVAVASKLAKDRGSYVIVTATDNLLNGVVIVVKPPRAVSDPDSAVVLCGTELGIVKECENVEKASRMWASADRLRVRIFVVPIEEKDS